jgi:hypothetical protein
VPLQNSDLIALTAMLVALQFAAFGWRIAREITMGDRKRRTWLPVPDVLNVASMLTVIAFAVVIPLATGGFARSSRIVLAVAFVLIGFHPMCMAGHYCIFSKHGRDTYVTKGKDWRYFPPPEILFVAVAVLAAGVAGYYVAYIP